MVDPFILLPPNSFKQFLPSTGQYFHWSLDKNDELPIKLDTQGQGSFPPFTFLDLLQQALRTHSNSKALAVKRESTWIYWTYKDFYDQASQFANALISLGVKSRSAVNIIGFNSPEWTISFFGSIFCNCIPIGVYITNGPEACQYIAEHSQVQVIVVQNQIQLQKYLIFKDKLPNLKAIVVYSPIGPVSGQKIYSWVQFLNFGGTERCQNRKMELRPSLVASIVYTSGTTGPPKGVMLTHNAYTWTARTFILNFGVDFYQADIVSYLPTSHIAAQIVDIAVPIVLKGCAYYADQLALQGSLFTTLQQVRPAYFFGVPRVFQKLEDRVKQITGSNSAMKNTLETWARELGLKYAIDDFHDRQTSLSFKLAKREVFDKIRVQLGLDRCKLCFVGAAPIQKATSDFFLSLNIPLFNAYGMSETCGPTTQSNKTQSNYMSIGRAMPGIQIVVMDPNTGLVLPDGTEGELCFRGRNMFNGYYKNEKNTREAIDMNGFIHSGDLAYRNQRGFFFITGRLKELIVTAGGENVPPVLIQDAVKGACPIISNAFLVGDAKPYLTIFVSVKCELVNAAPTDDLIPQVCQYFADRGIFVSKVSEVVMNLEVRKIVQEAVDYVNSKAVSRAQRIRKWAFFKEDFSVPGGEFTPTLKVRRREVQQKYAKEFDAIYEEPTL